MLYRTLSEYDCCRFTYSIIYYAPAAYNTDVEYRTKIDSETLLPAGLVIIVLFQFFYYFGRLSNHSQDFLLNFISLLFFAGKLLIFIF